MTPISSEGRIFPHCKSINNWWYNRVTLDSTAPVLVFSKALYILQIWRVAIYFVFLFEEQIVASKKKPDFLLWSKLRCVSFVRTSAFPCKKPTAKWVFSAGGYWRNWVSPQVSSWVEIGAANVRQPIASVEQNYVFFPCILRGFMLTNYL